MPKRNIFSDWADFGSMQFKSVMGVRIIHIILICYIELCQPPNYLKGESFSFLMILLKSEKVLDINACQAEWVICQNSNRCLGNAVY